MTSANGHQIDAASLERLVSEVQEQPVAEPKPKARRKRRSKQEIEADRAAKAAAAPAAIKLVIGGVAVEASAADAAQLLRHLNAA